ncbi:MAG: aquaporin family protein [Acidimicrobiia bacterium]|nr:aquaporin family protein [Acidimicrobiia bacterium]
MDKPTEATPTSFREVLAEFVGTAMLLVLIVGSGRQVEAFGLDPSAQFLAHSVSVGLGLAVLVAIFLGVSGAQFNPAVTLVAWWTREITLDRVVAFIPAQLAGAVVGVGLANVMFGDAIVEVGSNAREGAFVGEAVATFLLVLAIFALVRQGRQQWLPAAVGGIVAAVMIATASTAFANPAVTVGRVLTDSYTGIAPSAVPEFLAGQAIGALVAGGLALLIWKRD